MSGIDGQVGRTADEELEALFNVLDRSTAIDPLASLVLAMGAGARTKSPLVTSAIGLDANVFLRLGNHPRVADIVDYLGSQHQAPLILPGQTVQEFWNNQLAAVATMATSVKNRFEQFRGEAEKLDPTLGSFNTRMNALLDEYRGEYGHLYDEATIRSTLSLLEVLQQRATTAFVPRLRFQQMAMQRKQTKTPPGFKDSGDGDFYVWLDFLYSLQKAKQQSDPFTNAILVTNDQKQDWSRAGVPHPILSAEVMSLLGITFEVWTLDEFSRAIQDQIQDQ